eukprot:4866323-Amphidinium_carterae.1
MQASWLGGTVPGYCAQCFRLTRNPTYAMMVDLIRQRDWSFADFVVEALRWQASTMVVLPTQTCVRVTYPYRSSSFPAVLETMAVASRSNGNSSLTGLGVADLTRVQYRDNLASLLGGDCTKSLVTKCSQGARQLRPSFCTSCSTGAR